MGGWLHVKIEKLLLKLLINLTLSAIGTSTEFDKRNQIQAANFTTLLHTLEVNLLKEISIESAILLNIT